MIDNNFCEHKSKVLQHIEFWEKKHYIHIEGWNSGKRFDSGDQRGAEDCHQWYLPVNFLKFC